MDCTETVIKFQNVVHQIWKQSTYLKLEILLLRSVVPNVANLVQHLLLDLYLYFVHAVFKILLNSLVGFNVIDIRHCKKLVEAFSETCMANQPQDQWWTLFHHLSQSTDPTD